MNKEIKIPFAGFYETIASDEAERNAFMQWPKSGDYCDVSELPEELQNEFNDYLLGNCKQFEEELVDTYITNLFNEIKDHTTIDLTPKLKEKAVIDSPREYNFTTDRLFIKVSSDKLIELYGHLDKAILNNLIQEKFKPYSGFIPFYSNDPNCEEWTNIKDFDHNQWGTVLEAIMGQYKIEEYQLYS